MVNEVGVLTVARYLQEGVGDGVYCFVDTKYGLREVDGFVGISGAMEAILKVRRKPWVLLQPRTKVHLDTEVFLAKRNLAGILRSEVILIAERAASVDALAPSQQLCSSTSPMDVPHLCVNAPTIIEDEGVSIPTSTWQG